jgi:ketosteroid isomerase-like protein
MKTILSILSFVVIISILGCTKQVDVKVEQAALLNADKEWATAAAGDDIEDILTFWTDDAVIYFPNVPIVSGKEAIRQFVTNNRKKPGFSLTWEPTEAVVSALGDIGYTAGRGQLSINDSEGNLITRKMNYVCIWKKQADGSWKCSREVSNFRPQATQ